MAYSAFISHSVKDTGIVDQLADLMRRLQIQPYVAERDKQYGKSVPDKIRKNIRQCDVVIVLWTKESQHSEWVNQEIGCAVGMNIPILPILEKGLELKGFVQTSEWAELTRESVGEVAAYLVERRVRKELADKLAIALVLILIILGVAVIIWGLSRN